MSQEHKKKKKDKDKEKMPAHLDVQRHNVISGPDTNYHVNTVTSALAYMPLGIDNSWDLQEFKDNFKIEIKSMSEDGVMEFDMIGVDPAVANALRRILISEVPTMAIEHVFFLNNTSLIQDEVLAHRLGLVPLRADPRLFEFKTAEEAPSEKNTIVFKLDITCKRQGNVVINDKVKSEHLTFLPLGSELPEETSCRFPSGQQDMFPLPDEQPCPVHKDILLAKLRPGQSITLEAHCTKGIGREHAKWSPVATAWYRLCPDLVILEEPDAEMMDELVEMASSLFSIQLVGGKKVMKVEQLRGKNEKYIEQIRRLLEQERYRRCLQLRKRKDHFLFTIESTGVLPPQVLFQEALDILAGKAVKLANRM